MKIITDLRQRLYIEEAEDFIPDLTHFGQCVLSTAETPLHVHTHPGTLELVYVEKGAVTYAVDGHEHRVKGGDVFITFPDEEHCTGGHPEERRTFYWIGVNITRPGPSFLGLRSREARELLTALCKIRLRHFPVGNALKKPIHDFFSAYQSNLPYSRLLAQSALIQILHTLVDSEQKAATPPVRKNTLNALNYIEEHLSELIRIEDLAAAVFLSESRFKAVFKKEIGTPPYEYILGRKIEFSKTLLADRDKSITHIALDLGFSSSQHFATLFRKFTAITPTEYRRTLQK